jgi:hypothetical protein
VRGKLLISGLAYFFTDFYGLIAAHFLGLNREKNYHHEKSTQNSMEGKGIRLEFAPIIVIEFFDLCTADFWPDVYRLSIADKNSTVRADSVTNLGGAKRCSAVEP